MNSSKTIRPFFVQSEAQLVNLVTKSPAVPLVSVVVMTVNKDDLTKGSRVTELHQ